jgi:hypothetical protein
MDGTVHVLRSTERIAPPVTILKAVNISTAFLFHGRKEMARIGLAALFAIQRRVTENFNGNVAEVFRSSAAHYLN